MGLVIVLIHFFRADTTVNAASKATFQSDMDSIPYVACLVHLPQI